jgi:tetratricopeptide (TPR) repeat protein
LTHYHVAQLDEIETISGRRIPIRAHLDVQAFGINGWIGENAGDSIIGEHDEGGDGHEELYFVVRGHATFVVDGETIDAPRGTLVAVNDSGVMRKADAIEAGTVILAVGAKRGEAYSVSAWELLEPYRARGMELYGEKRYAEAADVFEEGVAAFPLQGGARYNAACMRALAGEAETALEHLRKALELDPGLAKLAVDDSDFDPIRPQVDELVGEHA